MIAFVCAVHCKNNCMLSAFELFNVPFWEPSGCVHDPVWTVAEGAASNSRGKKGDQKTETIVPSPCLP